MAKKLLSYLYLSGVRRLFAGGVTKRLKAGEAACICCRCRSDRCSDGGPSQWEVTLGGYANSEYCATCTEMNTTYVLDWFGVSGWPYYSCVWKYLWPATAPCDETRIQPTELWLEVTDSGIVVRVYWTDPMNSNFDGFGKVFATPLACKELSGENLPNNGWLRWCGPMVLGARTCVITAL